MSGSRKGGLKAAATNKAQFGEDWYSQIGAIGGRKSNNGGFGQPGIGRERARIYGAVGGTMSRRGDIGRTKPDPKAVAEARKAAEKAAKKLREATGEY